MANNGLTCLASYQAMGGFLILIRAKLYCRRLYRERQGCTEVPLPEAEISVPYSDLDSLRPRVEVNRLDQSASVSRQMVAEMMILAGGLCW